MKKSKKPSPPFLLIFLVVSVVLNFFFILKNYLPAASKTGNTSTETVTRVLDGDTFDTADEKRIRLALVDAPEYTKGCLSQEAKTRLEELVLGKTVRMEEVARENFGRSVAFVTVDNILVNKVLITEGLAQYKAENKLKDYTLGYQEAQAEAVAARRGIWSDKCQNKKKAGCVIKGNYRKDNRSKIYNLPDCYNYGKITVNLKEKDAWFCSEKEAQKAGFSKSLDCP